MSRLIVATLAMAPCIAASFEEEVLGNDMPDQTGDVSLVSLILGTSECTTAFDGGVGFVVLLAVVIYCFLGLAILCPWERVESSTIEATHPDAHLKRAPRGTVD